MDSESASSVIITGAGRGFGWALTSEFHSAGWHVIPIVRKAVDAEALSGAFPERCSPVLGDITKLPGEDSITKVILAAGRRLSVLINNAGIPGQGTTIDTINVNNIGSAIAAN